jgi:dTDP-4-amino-4,6-dideoxygalactose transaminase
MIDEEERRAAMDVLSGPILVHGPRSGVFEKAFADWTGIPNCVAVSSCTAAMHLVYFALGLGQGDEVIVPAQTHAATAHAAEFTGAKAIFVDAERRTGNIDLDQVEAAITPRTRAIAIVHYLGMPVDMDRLNRIAKAHSLFVLEDCALAIGTKLNDRHAGGMGAAGCFSFYPVKHMTTAEGGMIVTQDGELAARLVRLRAFGVDRHMGERTIPGVYDVTMLGYNYRMNEIQAAIGTEQVKKLDRFLERRRRNFTTLDARLREINEITLFDLPRDGEAHSYYCLTAVLGDHLAAKRTQIVADLNANGVGTSIYYPKPVPHMTYYRQKYGHTTDGFPNAAWISGNGIALPVGPHLDEDDMIYIADQMKNAISKVA